MHSDQGFGCVVVKDTQPIKDENDVNALTDTVKSIFESQHKDVTVKSVIPLDWKYLDA
jgi:hypothetical protein